MCGRYQFQAGRCAEMIQIAEEIERRYGPGSWAPGEMRPSMPIPVLVSSNGTVSPELYRWGYQLPRSLVINARSESAADKPMFRTSVASQRCVIPSTGFFEWDPQKNKYLFTLPGENALYMAGLYSLLEGRPCCCILTTQANESVKSVHHRMPLVLPKQWILPWLEQPESSRDILRMEPPALNRTAVDAQLSMW